MPDISKLEQILLEEQRLEALKLSQQFYTTRMMGSISSAPSSEETVIGTAKKYLDFIKGQDETGE